MNKPFLICVILVSVALFWTSLQAAVNPSVLQTSLCTKAERVVFNCQLKRPLKLVSLCRSPKFTKTDGYLQYRFGLPGKIELEFPKDRSQSQKLFHFSHYLRFQVDMISIKFSNDGYEYDVFYDYNGEEKPVISVEGLSITHGEKHTQYECRRGATNHLLDVEDAFENEFPN